MKPAISSEIGRVFVAFPPREKFATNLFFNTFFGMKRRGFFVKETRLVGVGPPAMTTSFCKCVLVGHDGEGKVGEIELPSNSN